MNLASRGLRDLDGGPEKVLEHAEATALRLQARKVLIKSVLAGAILTALALVP